MKQNNDTRLKALSVVIAILMWTFVINSTNPSVNKVFRNIPVIVRNQDVLEESGYTIAAGESTYTTNVKLRGTRERLINLRPENIYASIDISDLREGVQSLQIEVDTPTGVSVDEVEPGQVNLNIQRVIEKKLPVNLVITDEIKDGRIVEVNEIDPADITVKGPASLVNEVDRVEARIDDYDLLDGKVHNLPLLVLNRDGQAVDKVDISHDDINVSFLVYETKRVKVNMFTSGSINRDYEEESRAIYPDSIVIIGPESLIKDIDEVITKPINLNGLKESTTGEVKLDLPESVKVYNGENSVTYRIDIAKKAASRPAARTSTDDSNE